MVVALACAAGAAARGDGKSSPVGPPPIPGALQHPKPDVVFFAGVQPGQHQPYAMLPQHRTVGGNGEEWGLPDDEPLSPIVADGDAATLAGDSDFRRPAEPMAALNLVEYTLENGNTSGGHAARELQSTCVVSATNGVWSGMAPDMTFCGTSRCHACDSAARRFLGVPRNCTYQPPTRCLG